MSRGPITCANDKSIGNNSFHIGIKSVRIIDYNPVACQLYSLNHVLCQPLCKKYFIFLIIETLSAIHREVVQI